MNLIHIIFMLFLSLALCTGCRTLDKTSDFTEGTYPVIPLVDSAVDGPTVSTLNTYRRIALQNPEMYDLSSPTVRRNIYIDDTYLYVLTGNFSATGEEGTTVLKYDATGNLTETLKIPFFDEFPVLCERPLSDETFVYLVTDEACVRTTVFVCDTDRNILTEQTLSTYKVPLDMQTLSSYTAMYVEKRTDGKMRILINAYDRFYYLDESLCILQTVASDIEYTSIHNINDGIYILGDTLPGMRQLDMNAGTLSTIDIPQSHGMQSDAVYTYSCEHTLYCNDGTALYRMSSNSNSGSDKTEVIRWENGNCDGNGTVWVLNDTAVFYMPYSDASSKYSTLVLLTPNAIAENDHRRIVTLANLDFTYAEWLSEIVDIFNSQSEQYYVQIKDFSDVPPDKNSIQMFNEYLLSVGTPDLVFGLGLNQLPTYTEKNLFIDLAPHFSDTLLGFVKSAVTQDDGRQFSLPIAVPYISTYLSITMSDKFPTWEDMYVYGEAIDNNTDGVKAITSDEYLRDLFFLILSEFVDNDTKTATFDSPEFIERIRFLERMTERYIDTSYGDFTHSFQTGNDYALINQTEIIHALQNGSVLFLQVPIKSLGIFPVLQILFADTGYTLCGYPTETGTVPHVTADAFASISVFADSDVLNGCKEFLEFLLTDDIQSSSYIVSSALPVTRTGMRCALEQYHYSYFPEEFHMYSLADGDNYMPLYMIDHAAYPLQTVPKWARLQILSEEDMEEILTFFNTCTANSKIDPIILDIVTEELSAYESGAKTLEEVTRLMQSRVSIYLNE